MPTTPPHSIETAPDEGKSDLSHILAILQTLIKERSAANDMAARREERREAREDERERRQSERDKRLEFKLDTLTADVEALQKDNARQDRNQQHDSAVAEEALTLAAAKAGGTRGGLWGALVALAVAAITAAGGIIIEWIRIGAAP